MKDEKILKYKMKDEKIFKWKRIGSYSAADYRFFLNQIAANAKRKDEMTIDEKLAVALLFDLEYHARYQSDEIFMQAMALLDTYAVITKDDKDCFGREKIDISKIPLSSKRFFIKMYKDEIKDLDKTYKNLEKLVDSQSAELPLFNGMATDIVGDEEEADGLHVEGQEFEEADDDNEEQEDDEDGLDR